MYADEILETLSRPFPKMLSQPILSADEAREHFTRTLELPLPSVTLRAFTMRIAKHVDAVPFAMILDLARQRGWRVFLSDPVSDEYNVLNFINEAES